MEITPKIRKLIYGMFDTMIEGADKYVTKSSMWLIFTEEKRWVIEFTNTKTLWFNYNLFHSELKLLSMDCVESKDIIKEWFESRFLGINVVDETLSTAGKPLYVEDTIQNGVKHTLDRLNRATAKVEDTIQNGVKEISAWVFPRSKEIKNAIEFGGQQPPNVEKIITGSYPARFVIEDILQNGVKRTKTTNYFSDNRVEDTIQNGVKDVLGWNFNMRQDNVEDTIENGVKHTMWSNDDDDVEDTIENGVKQVKSDKGYMNHFKQIYRAEQTIENGVKETKTYTSYKTMHEYLDLKKSIEDAIQNGVKDIGARHLRINRKVDDAIENGVKEVKTPGVGDLVSTVEWMDENNTYNVPELIDDVIKNGVKE